LEALGGRIERLMGLVSSDMDAYAKELDEIECNDHKVGRSAAHLLALGGKRLRPMCVGLAARLGEGFSAGAFELGLAAELVHMATLLHDDVVDQGEVRRGQPAARLLYGNAASVFAGDWLLVEALRRVQNSRVPGQLSALLDTISRMIEGEALQLERRGSVAVDREAYFAVVEGKTAALFQWALSAGGRAGSLSNLECERLDRFGYNLGVAFQLVDDLLDYAGDSRDTGKQLFSDLAEGKVTYPLILGLEREPALHGSLEAYLAADGDERASIAEQLVRSLHELGAVADTRRCAHQHGDAALETLKDFPACPARTSLETVVLATVRRDR
jgi:octaprenyl-diphosphate synthase